MMFNEHKTSWPTERITLKNHFLDILSNEQRFRESSGIDWIDRERKVMFDEVNNQRALRNKSPMNLADIIKIETAASGHSDYSSKFALYCAELVLDDVSHVIP